jgi:hypothetical protein
VALAGAAACASAPGAVPVPTFPQAPSTAPQTRPPSDSILPAGCEDVVSSDELSALFALPVGSVAVRTVAGTPSPSVGRLERMTCTYTVVDPVAPQHGVVLRMTLGAYRDVAAARSQHERNVADQQGGADDPVRPELGEAAAAVVQRDGRSMLLTSYRTVSVDLDVATRPGPLGPVERLTDLARRVLARLVDRLPPADPTP